MRALFVLALASLVSCGFVSRVKAPPTYDEDCRPSDPFWLKVAGETTDLAPEGAIPSDPQEAYDKALAEVERLGLRLVSKREVGHRQWDGFSSTLPDTIFLAPDWDSKSVDDQARILWHELVHKRQWDRLGREAFLALYVTAEGRWALEVVAYRESFRVHRVFGVPNDQILSALPARADFLYQEYHLHSMPVCTQELSVEVWAQDFR